jgi:hypothetical protein
VWILHFLPDEFLSFIINGILFVGFVSTILTLFVINKLLMWFPAIAGYYRLIQAASVAIFLTGVYLKGGYSTEMAWRERVAEVEEKLKIAEDKSHSLNEQLNQKSQEKIKVIKGKEIIVKQYIDREIVKYDTKFMPGGVCEIPQEFVNAHNQAAEKPNK